MSLFTTGALRARARDRLAKSESYGVTAGRILEYARVPSAETFDIFLSHSFMDADLILGLRETISAMGFSIYVDWVNDADLDRSNVDRATALRIKERLARSRSLIYAFSESSKHSSWMPWELGYSDGLRGRVAVLPIVDRATDSYAGREYLGLYPYVQRDVPQGGANETLWVHESPDVYVMYSEWLNGANPMKR